MPTKTGAYIVGLRKTFSEYRKISFAGQDNLFEHRVDGDAVVFNHEFRDRNLIIPQCSALERAQIIGKIPRAKRHKHFGSMQSSQALTQSVFGAIEVFNLLHLMSVIKAEDGQPAFSPELSGVKLDFEKEIETLGEQPQRTTSVDVWFGGAYRVAVECKLAEPDFGTCSRPRLKPTDKEFKKQHCDGTYTHQRGRSERCALTEIKVKYWDYLENLFGWPSNVDYRPCPLDKTYQLVRNVLAASVDNDGSLNTKASHALIIYDKRNPAMATDGVGDTQWHAAYDALKTRGKLRRLSWQGFIGQWPSDPMLDWLKKELGAKYGLQPAAIT